MSVTTDHLSEEEVARVLELVHESDAIVVGGQCLAIWSRHYSARNPEIAKTYSMTSEDVDFYATPEAAKAFAAKLGNSKIFIPSIDDHTPNAAVVVGMLGQREIKVDFMHSILGVDSKSIENNFITLTGSRTDTGAEIEILLLHPLDCLRSRLSNINDLKRDDLAGTFLPCSTIAPRAAKPRGQARRLCTCPCKVSRFSTSPGEPWSRPSPARPQRWPSCRLLGGEAENICSR